MGKMSTSQRLRVASVRDPGDRQADHHPDQHVGEELARAEAEPVVVAGPDPEDLELRQGRDQVALVRVAGQHVERRLAAEKAGVAQRDRREDSPVDEHGRPACSWRRRYSAPAPAPAPRRPRRRGTSDRPTRRRPPQERRDKRPQRDGGREDASPASRKAQQRRGQRRQEREQERRGQLLDAALQRVGVQDGRLGRDRGDHGPAPRRDDQPGRDRVDAEGDHRRHVGEIRLVDPQQVLADQRPDRLEPGASSPPDSRSRG